MTGNIYMERYNIYYRSHSLLEVRQCSHESLDEAKHEAELYKAWAEFHYGQKVTFEIVVQ